MDHQNQLDNKSLSPGSFTFTRDRIESILRDNCLVRDANSHHNDVPGSFVTSDLLNLPSDNHSFDKVKLQTQRQKERDIIVEGFCTHLYNSTQDEVSHVSRLDDEFSTLVNCNFQPKESLSVIVSRTIDLLIRLPARSLELPDLPSMLNPAYLIPGALDGEDPTSPQWQNLQVAAHLNCNVIRVALLRVLQPGSNPKIFIDSIAELLDAASRLSSTAHSEPAKQRWFIVRAFLWTSWQRCTMISFSGTLDRYLKYGVQDEMAHTFDILRGTVPCPRLSIQDMSKHYTSVQKSMYMCGWAFKLLRDHPVCIGMDFRRFHQRYSETFRNHPGRCIPNQPLASCKGDQPDSCHRFKGMFIENQSAHDFECLKDCDRLTWDQQSYRSISGGRAVSINDSNSLETKIKYCEASEKTLAISHVWSHGQGGRPEQPYGFNRCLHRRYASIAKLLGCTSYWMDTPCIPEDHELRAEAISNINEVFFKSKVTLVCDRDLMEIDVTDMTIDVRERLLVTLIVSDWNVRSWTLLEAFRGRDAIYLLCKDNAVVSLKEAAEVVHRDGSIDVGLLLLTAPHLFPSYMKRDSPWRNETTQQPSDISGLLPSHINGYLSVEASGLLLSRREASRPGDDIVIWSLLLHEKVFEDAESFWRSREGRLVNTGYLMSSAPRLGIRGLGWAPSSPSVVSSADVLSKATSRLLGHGGRGNRNGTITRSGLVADWLMYDFIGSGLMSKTICAISDIKVGSKRFCRNNIRRIRERYMEGYRWGCLLRPITSQISELPTLNPGDSSRVLVVVCATNDRIGKIKTDMDHGGGWNATAEFKLNNSVPWEWKGIYEWDMSEPLPKFERNAKVLIV